MLSYTMLYNIKICYSENNHCVCMGDYPVLSHAHVGVHALHVCVDHEIGTYLLTF